VLSSRRPLLILAAALAVLATALYLAIDHTRTIALRADDRASTAHEALIAMLDQETGLRGFLLTDREEFLDPYISGGRRLGRSMDTLADQSGGDRELLTLGADMRHTAAQWHALAEGSIDDARRAGRERPAVAEVVHRKVLMDRFRTTQAALATRLQARSDRDLERASALSTIFVVLLTALMGICGLAVIRRLSRVREEASAAELSFRRAQREFTDVIQVVQSEGEAHGVLKRHLERSIAGGRATVLSRNNSDNRLEATTEVPDGTALAEGLRHADPGACVAVRLARPHQGGVDPDPLLSCRVCGGIPGTTSCQPLLVGGKVIGAVLVEHDAPLDDAGERVMQNTVSQAAPVLANMRTIAMAESRAATDALTGLANRRALQDTLNRMAAHASRAVSPLSAITMDLDHFKQINDRYGHDRGDMVLAAVGDLLRTFVRESDFVSRLGGEEFVILTPDTGREGAANLAEKLRDAISRAEIAGVEESVTASFGIAVMPDDAGTGEQLLRHADRALYLAKELGRNRVESSSPDLS
jgi:diguanylate cyclase (GGDEF)-like protein